MERQLQKSDNLIPFWSNQLSDMKTVLCFKGSQANKAGNYFLKKSCSTTGEGSEQDGGGN